MFGRDLKTAMLKILTDPEGQLDDIPALVADPELKKVNEDMKIDIQVVIAGVTKRDTEYKEKALDKILELTGGWKSESCSRRRWSTTFSCTSSAWATRT